MEMQNKFHHKWFYFFVAIALRLALEFSYTDFVAPLFDYAGLTISNNQEKYIESWFIYIALLFIIPKTVKKPSDLLVGLAFFVYVAPLLVFYALANPERISLYLAISQFIIMDIVRRFQFFSIPSITNGYALAKNISIASIVIATAWMILTVGFSNFNLDDAAVYDFRDEANSAIYRGPMGYLTIWATNICSSILLLIALRDKKYYWAIAIALMHVIWFGISTHKSVLFYPIQVGFIYLVFRRFRSIAILPLGLLVIVGISIAIYFLTDSIVPASLFVRRVFFVPSHLTFTYLDFFSYNPFVYWSNSFFSLFIAYPYSDSVALVIGNHLGDNTLWANNSFFSTGFMHAGLFGLVLYGIAAGVILSIIDSYARRGLPIHIILAVVIVPFYNLYTSADLTTSLLTHGLVFAIFMLSLLSGGLTIARIGSPNVLRGGSPLLTKANRRGLPNGETQ
jgi:hypothetical protein